MITDIEWSKTQVGYYDFTITDGDFTITNTLDSAIVMSLFGNVRAEDTEVVIPQNRGGWWGNLFSGIPGYQYGSKLWLLNQARNTQLTLNQAISYFQASLSWLIDDGYATQIDVDGAYVSAGIELQVVIKTVGGSLLARTYLIPRSL